MNDVRDIAPASPGACGCAACRPSPQGSAVVSVLPRRRFLAIGAGASLAAAVGVIPRRAQAQSTMTPDAALARLMAGNARYVAGDLTSFRADLAELKARTVEKQEPFAALLSCADSRVPVEIVFDQSIGELFVTRVAGNVATNDVIASLEYGAAVLGTRAILVLAHQGCGAVKAAVAGKAVPGQISTLFAPLQPAVAQGHHDYETTSKLNAKIQADLLGTASPVLAELVKDGRLKIAAGYYSLETGTVSLL